MSCNSSFLAPFRAFRDQCFPGPSIPAGNKQSRSGTNLPHPGKTRSNQVWGQSVAHIPSLSFPQHQPGISTLRLCQKPPSSALHAKRGRLQVATTPTAAAAQGTPQHQHLESALKTQCGRSSPALLKCSLSMSKQSHSHVL